MTQGLTVTRSRHAPRVIQTAPPARPQLPTVYLVRQGSTSTVINAMIIVRPAPMPPTMESISVQLVLRVAPHVPL